MKIRKYHPKDCKKIIELFYGTVHFINAEDYNETQLIAWAPKNSDLLKWDNKLSNNYSIVSEKDDMITGFGTVDYTGYFDLYMSIKIIKN